MWYCFLSLCLVVVFLFRFGGLVKLLLSFYGGLMFGGLLLMGLGFMGVYWILSGLFIMSFCSGKLCGIGWFLYIDMNKSSFFSLWVYFGSSVIN